LATANDAQTDCDNASDDFIKEKLHSTGLRALLPAMLSADRGPESVGLGDAMSAFTAKSGQFLRCRKMTLCAINDKGAAQKNPPWAPHLIITGQSRAFGNAFCDSKLPGFCPSFAGCCLSAVLFVEAAG
jgi:hypothetical protein